MATAPALPPMLARMPEPGPHCKWEMTGGACGEKAVVEIVTLAPDLVEGRTVDDLFAMHGEAQCDRHAAMQISAYERHGTLGSVTITRRLEHR